MLLIVSNYFDALVNTIIVSHFYNDLDFYIVSILFNMVNILIVSFFILLLIFKNCLDILYSLDLYVVSIFMYA